MLIISQIKQLCKNTDETVSEMAKSIALCKQTEIHIDILTLAYMHTSPSVIKQFSPF